MASLNFNEIGQIVRVNVGKDISLSTPTLILEPETGLTKEITIGVSIPSVPATEGGETFLSNEYIEYKTIVDDLDFAGRWRKKAKLEFSATNIEQTDFIKFRVLP